MMDHDLKNRLVYELKVLMKDREAQAERLDILEPYRGQRLKVIRNRNGRRYYCVKSSDGGAYKYIGKEPLTKVQRIKEVAHLEESLKKIEENIRLIEDVLDGLADYDLESIGRLLPRVYRFDDIPAETAYQRAGMSWKEDRLRFRSRFPENYPEKKVETAADGTEVKSKNEVIVYNKLLDAGLFLLYELPFVCDDYGPPIYPDITVLSPVDMKTEIIIEVVGLLDTPQYRDSFSRKTGRYISSGHVPGIDLFFVFTGRDGHIDSLQVKKVIADIFGLR